MDSREVVGQYEKGNKYLTCPHGALNNPRRDCILRDLWCNFPRTRHGVSRDAGCSMSVATRVRTAAAVATFVLAGASVSLAQKVTTIGDLTLQQTIVQLTDVGPRPSGEAIALTTALEIATQPFGTSSGGFVFKLDPATGLLARTSTTFGPSFTERALTAGEGNVSIGATFSGTTYDKISDFSLSRLPLLSGTAPTAAGSRTGTADLNLSSRTLALSGTVGVTDTLDIGVVVPLVTIKLNGTSALVSGTGNQIRLAETAGSFSGLGDIAAMAKFRFVKFKGPDLPDPGGAALLVNMRLPTGDKDNLRGLGIYRTMIGGTVSGGKGKFRPHGMAGFEYWSKGVHVSTGSETVTVRHQIQYAGGIEVEAHPKLTLLVDFLGQQIRGGGQVGLVTDTPPANPDGISSITSMAALAEGIRKALLVPGLKLNVKGKMLVSLNAIITLHNNGLHSTVTPVVGVNLTL